MPLAQVPTPDINSDLVLLGLGMAVAGLFLGVFKFKPGLRETPRNALDLIAYGLRGIGSAMGLYGLIRPRW